MSLSVLINTVLFLKPIQIISRIPFIPFYKFKNNRFLVLRRKTKLKWIFIEKSDDQVVKNYNFSFLNEKGNLISLGWGSKKKSDLWNFNLNYFDYLTNKNINFTHSKSLILNWIDCHKNNLNLNIGNHSYPTSLRIVNWIKWSLSNNYTEEIFLNSLTKQSFFLYHNIEYNLLGNHILKNSKALIFFGIFTESEFSKKCLVKGMKIFSQEIDEQILSDGAHFEQSPMYHSIIMEDCLDILYMFKIFNNYKKILKINELEKKIKLKLKMMSYWYDCILHPDNDIPFINDSCFKIAPNKKHIQDYFKLLNLKYSKKPKKKFQYFKPSGFCSYNTKNIFTLIDISNVKATYIPGHSHADTLSFESSFYNFRCIVNSGISTYEDNQLRHFQRSTKSHNTLNIKDYDSSQVWKSFRLGKRAAISKLKISKTKKHIKVFAQHDGYNFLGNIFHDRYWFLEDDSIVIKDIVNSNLSAKSNFFIHPFVKIQKLSSKELFLVLPSNQKIKVIVNNGNLKIEKSNWYPEFGLSIPNNLLSLELVDNISEIRFQL